MKENKTTMNAQARTEYEPVSVRVVKVTPQGVLCQSSPESQVLGLSMEDYTMYGNI